MALCIRLCQECQTLIENHDQIKLLSNARNNLNTTLKVGVFNLSWISFLSWLLCVIVPTICSLGKKSYTVLFWIFVSILSKAVTWKCSHTRMLHATDHQSSGVGIAWQDFILQKRECETNGYLCCWCFVRHAFISFKPWGMKLYDLLVCCFFQPFYVVAV